MLFVQLIQGLASIGQERGELNKTKFCDKCSSELSKAQPQGISSFHTTHATRACASRWSYLDQIWPSDKSVKRFKLLMLRDIMHRIVPQQESYIALAETSIHDVRYAHIRLSFTFITLTWATGCPRMPWIPQLEIPSTIFHSSLMCGVPLLPDACVYMCLHADF